MTTPETSAAPAIPNRFGLAILTGLNFTNKHVYAGTVPERTKRKRRAAGAVAKQSRKINRGSK